MNSKRKIRGRVILKAYGASGVELLSQDISFESFYDGENPVIDRDEYRKQMNIRKVVGEVYDLRGVIVQLFVNEYGEFGEFVKGTSTFEDGTIQERRPANHSES